MSGFAEPMTVTVVDGDVVVLGPDAVGVSLTPEAADESGRRLQQAAAQLRDGASDQPDGRE